MNILIASLDLQSFFFFVYYFQSSVRLFTYLLFTHARTNSCNSRNFESSSWRQHFAVVLNQKSVFRRPCYHTEIFTTCSCNKSNLWRIRQKVIKVRSKKSYNRNSSCLQSARLFLKRRWRRWKSFNRWRLSFENRWSFRSQHRRIDCLLTDSKEHNFAVFMMICFWRLPCCVGQLSIDRNTLIQYVWSNRFCHCHCHRW
jgi:hypothetical protein